MEDEIPVQLFFNTSKSHSLEIRDDAFEILLNTKDIVCPNYKLFEVINIHFPNARFFPTENQPRIIKIHLYRWENQFKCNLNYSDGKIECSQSKTGFKDYMVLHECLKSLKFKVKNLNLKNYRRDQHRKVA